MGNSTKFDFFLWAVAFMNIPSRVKVGGLVWTVKIDQNLGDSENAWGLCKHGQLEILLDGQQAHGRMIKTFFHELVHVMLHETGDYDLSKNEEFVNRFSNVLTQVFLDNGWRFGGDGVTTKRKIK